jgi:hypothetical protein
MSAERPLANIADTAGNIALGSPSGHRAASALPLLHTKLYRRTPPFQQSPARAPARAERDTRDAPYRFRASVNIRGR